MSIGKRLKSERQRLGLNQTKFAQLMHVSQGSQVGYESDIRTPDAHYFVYADEVGVDICFVIKGIKIVENEFDWPTIDSVLFSIETWLDVEGISLPFHKKMDLLRLFLKKMKTQKEIDKDFIFSSLKLVINQ